MKPAGDVLRRTDWTVRPVPDHQDAVATIAALHYAQGAPNTSTARHGLYRTADGPILAPCYGVALWLPPTATAGRAIAGAADAQRVLMLSRLVLDPAVPTNGASFLLAASRRLIDRARWPVLVTYADTNEGHTGAIYLADNWTRDGEVPAGVCWEMPSGRVVSRRRGGRNLTVAELRGMGAVKRPQRPKIRYRHDARP